MDIMLAVQEREVAQVLIKNTFQTLKYWHKKVSRSVRRFRQDIDTCYHLTDLGILNSNQPITKVTIPRSSLFLVPGWAQEVTAVRLLDLGTIIAKSDGAVNTNQADK